MAVGVSREALNTGVAGRDEQALGAMRRQGAAGAASGAGGLPRPKLGRKTEGMETGVGGAA